MAKSLKAIEFNAEAKAKAEAEGLHLVRIEVFGHHAKSDTVKLARTVSRETADKVWALVNSLVESK